MNEAQANVGTRWRRLLEVLQERGALHTVDALAPGLAESAITDAVSDVEGLNDLMSGQIRDLFGCVNGFRDGVWTPLFPDVDLLSVQGVIDTRQMMLDAAPAPPGYESAAGTPVYGFIPEFLPFAERDGYMLVVDLREGDEQGLVICYDKVDADDDATTWRDVDGLVAELTAAIETGSEFASSTPVIEDATLRWA